MIAPLFNDLSKSIINSLEIDSFLPKPLHSGQAPKGELNENNLGSKLASE